MTGQHRQRQTLRDRIANRLEHVGDLHIHGIVSDIVSLDDTTSGAAGYLHARDITTGTEVLAACGAGHEEWLRVAQAVHVTAPIEFVRLDFDGDGFATMPPDTEVWSRRQATNGACS